jgi:lactoylglutathione lyase
MRMRDGLQILGMDLLSELPQSSFTLYFLGYSHGDTELSSEEKAASRFSREGLLLISMGV